MSINKQGVWRHNDYEENGLSTYNFFNGFSNKTSTVTFSAGQYTVVSSVASSAWGSQIMLKDDAKIVIPYGCYYRATIDVYIPTTHNVRIDINNRSSNGTNWGSNDNDTNRTSTTFTIPAETWTTITWGGSNTHANNTNKEDLYVYDSIGLVNSSDSEATTWYIRNPRVYIGFNSYTNAKVFNEHMRVNEIYED